MKPMPMALSMIALCSVLSSEPSPQILVEESGSDKIDRLVAGLVSRRPAPLPSGGRVPGTNPFADLRLINESGRHATPEVEAAIQMLMAIPPSEYPHLVKHILDDRYSYSVIGPFASPTRSGWTNHDVGDAAYMIISNDYYQWMGGYRGRRKQSPPTFWEYMEARGGADNWAASVVRRSRTEIDLDFIDWCIETERARGFDNKEEEERIIGSYKKYKKVEQDGADQPATPNESKPKGNEKPEPESTGAPGSGCQTLEVLQKE